MRVVPPSPGTRAAFKDREVIVPASDPAEARLRLLYLCTAETESILRVLVPAWSKRLGLRPRSVTVRLAKTRWGSCTARGDLFFSSRIATLPDDVANYLVVHELTHIKQMDHSRAFWDKVEAALPGAKALRRKLRECEGRARL